MQKRDFIELKRDNLHFFDAIRKLIKQKNLRIKELGYRIKNLDDCLYQIEVLSDLLKEPMDDNTLVRTLAKVPLLLKAIFSYLESYLNKRKQVDKLKKIAQAIAGLDCQITPLIQRLDPAFIHCSSQEFLDEKVGQSRVRLAEKSVLDDIKPLYQARYNCYRQGLFGQYYYRFKRWNRQKDRQAELAFIEAVDNHVKNNPAIDAKGRRIIIANTLILVRSKIKAEIINQLPFCRSELVAAIDVKLDEIKWSNKEEVTDNFLDFLTKADIKVPSFLEDFFYQQMELSA